MALLGRWAPCSDIGSALRSPKPFLLAAHRAVVAFVIVLDVVAQELGAREQPGVYPVLAGEGACLGHGLDEICTVTGGWEEAYYKGRRVLVKHVWNS